MFFGFTNCTDECPTTLSLYRRVKQQLGDLADNVRFVFVTVDPERDTSERIQAYLAGFDPAFIGLTSDPSTLQQVWQDYGVLVEKQSTGNDGGYEVEHNTRIYAIDKQGSWRLTYPYGMDSEKLVRDVAHLVKEKSSQ